eukprot:m.453182 g.453182  ORF g.453182 m.453182 type:complete len:77 (+) comp20450_c0_seq1:286-516(+)
MVEFFFERATLRGSCGGRQYMEGVWWHSEAQKTILDTKLAELRKTQTVNLHTAAVTDVYRAEEYHQRYYAKMGVGS